MTPVSATEQRAATLKPVALGVETAGTPADALRFLAIAAGLAWAIIFVVIGLGYELNLYGDGAIFSYAVAVQDSWAFHWHNISGRLFVYFYAIVPAEAFVEWTGDARGGVMLYAFLFLGAQLFGLAATYFADPSPRRTIFAYACASTALVLPIVFGFPTETLMAHALFWPTLALAHRARDDAASLTLLAVLLFALMFTHAGAIILLFVIVASLVLRGLRRAAYRTGALFLVALFAWLMVKTAYKPDAYIAGILYRAMMHVFDPTYVMNRLLGLIGAALALYGAVYAVSFRVTTRAHLVAAGAAAAALAVYWLVFDVWMHAENRYYMRTVVLTATPAFGLAACLVGFETPFAFVGRIRLALANRRAIDAAIGALLVVTLIHAVETVKFVSAWDRYKSAASALGESGASDPSLGDPRFVSAKRIDPALDPLSWWSTTHFLSVMVAPQMSPAHLVVDPRPNWFWISCKTATRNADASKAVPAESRHLIALHACLHRK